MNVPSALVQRIRLGRELRRVRAGRGLTRRQVASTLNWEVGSLIRIEAGATAVSDDDLRKLLTSYGIREQREADGLLELASGGRTLPFSEYGDIYPAQFLRYLALESAAATVRYYHPLVVPGLLQTEEYAAAVIGTHTPGESAERLDRMTRARLARQEQLLQGDRGPRFVFLLDESVLRRQVGQPDVMRAQLLRLAELAGHSRIELSIVPFSAGRVAGAQGPFVLLEFGVDGLTDTVFLEQLRGDSLSGDTDETSRYLEVFESLDGQAVKSDVAGWLRRVAGENS